MMMMISGVSTWNEAKELCDVIPREHMTRNVLEESRCIAYGVTNTTFELIPIAISISKIMEIC